MNTNSADFRSRAFNTKSHGRYWWFSSNRPEYVPPIFDFLSEAEWNVMDAWYGDSEALYQNGTGECNVPAMSLLMGLIMGNNISKIVQCGHFIGFSTLLLGFMLRRMGHKCSLFSIDIDQRVTEYTQKWINVAELQDYIQLAVSNSAASSMIGESHQYLGGKPQLLFIDSSHERNHTVAELKLWLPNIQPGGFAVLHDVSDFAKSFDSLGGGGVKEAVAEVSRTMQFPHIMINEFCGAEHFGDRTVYKDACGLGIIQVPS